MTGFQRRTLCFVSRTLYEVLKVQTSTFHKQAKEIFLDSSMVERTAVNRDVVGSSPTRGVFFNLKLKKRKKKKDMAPWSSGQDIALSRR